jgi:hypothetical protein
MLASFIKIDWSQRNNKPTSMPRPQPLTSKSQLSKTPRSEIPDQYWRTEETFNSVNWQANGSSFKAPSTRPKAPNFQVCPWMDSNNTSPQHNTEPRQISNKIDMLLCLWQSQARSTSGTYYYVKVNNDRKHAPTKAIKDYYEHLSCYWLLHSSPNVNYHH